MEAQRVALPAAQTINSRNYNKKKSVHIQIYNNHILNNIFCTHYSTTFFKAFKIKICLNFTFYTKFRTRPAAARGPSPDIYI